MKFNKTALLAVLFGMTLSLGAHAQDAGQSNAQQQQSNQAATNVDNASLNKFKDAFAQVNGIRESFAGKLENVEDPKKARKLQQQAQQDMVSAVEDAGLSVQEYNQIFAAVQQSPELQKKVLGNQ